MTKRTFDMLFGITLLIVLLPLIIALAVIVRMSLGSPVIFRQKRPGLHGEIFEIYKFRTMTNQRGEDGQLLSDAERLTALGRFLRKTSLDELPELWNILKGEMSFVGPRPLLVRYLPYYTDRQARRHEVRPGLTGWAQINGRNALSWEDKFEKDVWYVENQSFALDLKIIVLTIIRIFHAEGISQDGHSTVEFFDEYLSRLKEGGERFR